MITIPTVDELHLGPETRVFYRVDYNVPLENGAVSDATRIEETLPTIRMMRERGARIILASHLGRPKGAVNSKDSLQPVLLKLSELSGLDVKWGGDCIGEEARRLASELKPGELLLVENLRFHAGEEKNDKEFAAKLRELGDVYVNDAFGASHRAHASIVALAELFPKENRAGGILLAKELEFLQKVTDVSERPFVAILGGAKIAGKIEPLEVMVNLADSVLIGGGMANTFWASQGKSMGASLVDADSLPVAARILTGKHQATIVLPEDFTVTDSIEGPTAIHAADLDPGIDAGWMAVDIGSRTIAKFTEIIAEAKTIFWNGPMGVFEKEAFASGTHAIAKAIAENAGAVSVVGGGESVEAVKESGFADKITHISTGGGASLEFIAGRPLPGIEVLRHRSS
ncbi:MAG TPA: phosphoglycerate kinase [Thermoanaerobaculia bacterium]